MEFIIILIPVITVIYLAYAHMKDIAWWEWLIVTIPSLLLFVILKYGFIIIKSMDIEYLGDIVNTVTYYEPWNEMVTVVHTRTVTTGNGKTRTETYTTQELRNHSAEYVYTTTHNNTETVSKETFDSIVKHLNVSPVFKDMHRHYYTKDGDAYVYTWNRTMENSYPVTESHLYRNNVKASSHSIFKYGNITTEEARQNKLYDYPSIENCQQQTVLGISISDSTDTYIKYLNGIKGPQKQFRLFILGFDSPSFDIAEMQQAYWQSGNKNELVVCLGIKDNKVTWCYPFSWCDEPILEVKTRSYFIEHPDLNLYDYISYIDKEIDISWNRKSFNDFNYINVELSPVSYFIILLLVLLYNIGISIWVVNNNYIGDNSNQKVNMFLNNLTTKTKLYVYRFKQMFIKK